MELNLEEILNKVIQLSSKVAIFIKEESEKISKEDVEIKSSHDYVTYVDKTSEAMLVKGLSEILPEAGYIAEEGTSNKKGDRYNWIIDPLDGTTNFIHGIPFYCISIALQDLKPEVECENTENGEIILGLIHHVSNDEKFYSYKSVPAFLNGKEIKVSNIQDLDSALLVTGFPYHNYDKLEGYMKLLEYTMQHTSGLRRLGSAALDLAYVAAGRCELFYEYGLQPWDVAAGLFLVKQAGGKVCDFAGGSNYLFGKEIITGNLHLTDKFLSVVKLYMGSSNNTHTLSKY